MKTRRLSLVLVAASLAFPTAAHAHATLVRSTPEDGAALATAPAAVRLVFDDVVQVAGGDAVVRNRGKVSVLAGPPRCRSRTRCCVLRRLRARSRWSPFPRWPGMRSMQGCRG